MTSSMPSSGYLADNIDHIVGLSTDIYAMTVYGKTTTRRGMTEHHPIHDAVRALLLKSSEPTLTAHIGKVAYEATKVGDDQYVISWRTGAEFAKSKARAIRRAIRRKVDAPRVLTGQHQEAAE